MKSLRINIMAVPPNNETGLKIWLEFIETLLPFATVFGGLWKGIHELFKYLSEKRKMELKEMIKDEVAPQIDKLSDAIDKLSERINRMN